MELHIYGYNEDGIRVYKAHDNTVTQYYLDGDKVVREETFVLGQTTIVIADIYYAYDSNGQITGMNYNDSWGKLVNISGDQAQTIGVINPYRYRGYRYDEESRLYYLQSRYCDPEVGRFLNADDVTLVIVTPMNLTDKNLFSYCDNNLVNCSDTGGTAWEAIVDIASIGWSAWDLIREPSWANIGYLAWDIGSAVVPFVPGSYVARGAKIVSKGVTKAGKVVGKSVEIVRKGKKVLAVGKYAAKAASKFSELSKARQYGIKAYSALRKVLKGTGLHAHHIIEQRLVKHLGINVNKLLSVAVTPAEHQKFTNKWRKLVEYGTDYTTLKREKI